MRTSDSTLCVLVAVRIGIHNDRSVENCIESLIRASNRSSEMWGKIEITVIDDHSQVSSRTSLNSMNAQGLTVIQNEGLPGQGGALNYGLSVVPADAYAFTDIDCIVADDWFIRLAIAYNLKPECNGVAGPNWLHIDTAGRWSGWLTKQEERLAHHLFVRYVDHEGWTGRIDCRSLSIRSEFITKIAPDYKFFAEGIGPSVSGLTSHSLRGRFTPNELAIRFDREFHARHRPVQSIRQQINRYFRWGRDGNYATYYHGHNRWMIVAFTSRHLIRHFILPILIGRSSPLYVFCVHGAYWVGIALSSLRKY